jgi:hypothetical protein
VIIGINSLFLEYGSKSRVREVAKLKYEKNFGCFWPKFLSNGVFSFSIYLFKKKNERILRL